MLRLWNTLHRQLEIFEPIETQSVRMYTCGPTVYNPVTLGNWRAFLFDDILRRALQFFGYRVVQVMNITDVGHLVGDADEGEDKVEREAAKRGVKALELARSLEADFLKGMERLHIEHPEFLPRATEHIPEQIALIVELEKKGFAYRISDGLYFDTAKFLSYGALSGQRVEDKEAGARVAVHPEKRHASDFALWKFSPTDQLRQMEWESPWGRGFPGWHIECSAMSVRYLGQPFDIHTGGIDHIPVHHENEIAQTEAATGKPLARFWLHNEFLLVDGRRMGKSEGNADTLEEVVARGFDVLAFRYFVLGTHYRAKLNFTWEALEGAQHALRKLRVIARSLPSVIISNAKKEGNQINHFRAALEDDLNTPQALAVLWDVLKSNALPEEKSAFLAAMDRFFGLGLAECLGRPLAIPAHVFALAKERQAARAKQDWKKSDELRETLRRQGWIIEDTKEGEFDLQAV